MSNTINFRKQLRIFIPILCIIVAITGAMTNTVYASTGDANYLPKKDTIYKHGAGHKSKNNTYLYGIPGEGTAFYADSYDVAKLKSVKSSNPSVASAKLAMDNAFIAIKVKKKGTTTIKAVTAKGTVHRCRLTVIPYKNPFKSVKIGTKELKKIVNNSSKYEMTTEVYSWSCNIKPTGEKKKVSVKTNKGFKSLKICYDSKNIKNGSMIAPFDDSEDPNFDLSVVDNRTGKKLYYLGSLKGFFIEED